MIQETDLCHSMLERKDEARVPSCFHCLVNLSSTVYVMIDLCKGVLCMPPPRRRRHNKQEELLVCQQNTGNHDKHINHITAASDVIHVCMHLSPT